MPEIILLLIIKVIPSDRTLEPIFNNLASMQSNPVDLVPPTDERKVVTNVQLIRGISKGTSSVFFELMLLSPIKNKF